MILLGRGCVHVVRDTRMHTDVRQQLSAALRPPALPLGKRSLSIFGDPPPTLRHTHTCAALHLLGSISVGDRCILSLAKKHPCRESIHLTTEAFNTFKNSISKIATCLGETDRAGRRGAVKEGGWGGSISEQEARLLIYVRQWMKASGRQAEKEQP